MLAAAGFIAIELFGDYTDDPPTSDSGFVVFHARKPENRRLEPMTSPS
jgi:hypothetical protein